MSAGTLLVGIAVAAGLSLAARSVYRTKKNGGCGCGCDGCSASCHKNDN